MIASYRPATLDEALKHLDQEVCHIFAGGTDLMIRKRQWQGAERKFTQPIVFIAQLDELRFIRETETHYEIGTLTTQTDIVNSDLPEYIREPYRQMSHPAIRNIATVGGNIVNAASVADSLPVLYALDAVVELKSLHGTRELPIEAFIQGKYKTKRANNEMLTKVMVPKLKDYTFFYKKLGQRKASILSKLSVFIVHNELKDIRLAIGAVNDTVIRSRMLEATFKEDHNLDTLLGGLKEQMHGMDDKRSTKDYREKVTLGLVEDYLRGILDEH